MTFDPLYILVAAACVSLVAFVVILVRLKAMGRPEPIIDFGGDGKPQAGGTALEVTHGEHKPQSVTDRESELELTTPPIPSRKAMADAKHKMAREIRERIENTTL